MGVDCALTSDGMQCDICGSRTAPINIGGSPFWECVACGFGRLTTAAATEYWSETHESSGDVSDFWVGAKKAYFEAALEILEAETRGRSLIDIGGGVGYFSELAIGRGWDAYSLDISPIATGLAAERLGRDRVLEDLGKVEANSFDAATLWCVIAHTREPIELMASVRRVLKPGAVVWITTPNFAFQKPYSTLRAFVRKPIDFAAEGHVGNFTPGALEELLQRSGFALPTQHFAGVTEVCCLTGTPNSFLVQAKRLFNRTAFVLAVRTKANYVSELQVTARAITPTEDTPGLH